MKAQLNPEIIVLFDWSNKETKEYNLKLKRSIEYKLQKIIELPIVPQIGMTINLPPFKEVFKFTEEECEVFYSVYWRISDIDIMPEYLRLWFEDEE